MISLNQINNQIQKSDPIERIIQLFLAKECSLNTEKRKNYDFILHEFFREINAKEISSLSADDILRYKAFLYGMLQRGHYKPNTVRNKVHIVSSFFGFTHMAGFTPQLNNRAFMYLFKGDLPREEIPEKDILAVVARLDRLKQVAEPGSRARAELSLFLNAGIRVSELINIQCEDIYLQGDWFLKLRKTKGNKQRQPIKVHECCIEEVSTYQEQNEVFEGWLFPSPKNLGQHITRKTVFLDIQQLGGRIGIEFSPHWLRHVAAFLRRQAGDPLDEIKVDYGHTVLSTTERYTHAELIMKERKARRIF